MASSNKKMVNPSTTISYSTIEKEDTHYEGIKQKKIEEVLGCIKDIDDGIRKSSQSYFGCFKKE